MKFLIVLILSLNISFAIDKEKDQRYQCMMKVINIATSYNFERSMIKDPQMPIKDYSKPIYRTYHDIMAKFKIIHFKQALRYVLPEYMFEGVLDMHRYGRLKEAQRYSILDDLYQFLIDEKLIRFDEFLELEKEEAITILYLYIEENKKVINEVDMAKAMRNMPLN